MKKITLTITILLLTGMVTAFAQLNPLGAQYFQNQYLANPAVAGIKPGLELAGALKAQWTSITGSPVMQSATATFGSNNNRVGLGLNFYNESSGVLNRTSLKASYAYHLPVNQQGGLIDFGLSAGYMDEWIDFNKVKGDISDGTLSTFNERKLYFDGDFGIGFHNQNLNIQGVLPNLKRLFDRDLIRSVADRSLYLASASYRIDMNNGESSLEPKIVYRGVQNYKDIVDICANLRLSESRLMLSGIYHSTNSFTIGAGTIYRQSLSILCQYTTNTSALQSYTNGEFEIGIKYHFN